MTKTIVAPSILSLDYANVSEQLKQLNESKAEWLHFDGWSFRAESDLWT